jgi:hypothetical protein
MAQVIEYFDVLYTKHIKQKSKSWEDGFLEYHLKSSKVSVHLCSCLSLKLLLYTREAKSQQIDSKMFRIMVDLEPGSRFQLNRYLVEIEVSHLSFSNK